jgi:spore coat protein U-like protein
VALDTGVAGSGCAGASGGGSINGFMVSASMQPTCQVNTNPMDFGVVNGDPSGYTATTTLTVACNFHGGYRVGLDNGKNFQSGSRNMRGGPTHSDYIAYELYRDGGYVDVWGNTDGTDTVPDNSNGTYTVYGKIAPNQGMPAGGNYFDAVTVYVYY